MARFNQDDLIRAIKEELNATMNNPDILADKIGMDRIEMEAWVNAALNDRSPLTDPEQIDAAVHKLVTSPEFGDYSRGEGSEVYRVEGENYLIRDYQINPGEGVPEGEYTYQVIIKGIMNGEERYVTTNVWNDLDGAVGQAASMCGLYEDFFGVEYIVRTFAETW